jgi:glyoxylase-like metal-dependent hydrolase (beta-lactamase superfamily II)
VRELGQQWHVYAVRYATRESRRQESFLRYYVYGEQDAPLQLDYYFWVLRSSTEVVLVDTGIDVARQRPGRNLLITPLDALRALDLAADDVGRVVVSHCHSDHIGSLSLFPGATLTVQRRELDFWNGPIAERQQFATTVKRDQLDYLASAVRDGTAEVIDGDAQLGDGLAVRLVGGHCPGQQIAVVDTPSGPVVLPSDAMHFYEELERELPFSVLWNLAEVYQCYDLLNSLQGAGATLVPGHDPEVMRRFPAIATSEHIVRIA